MDDIKLYSNSDIELEGLRVAKIFGDDIAIDIWSRNPRKAKQRKWQFGTNSEYKNCQWNSDLQSKAKRNPNICL